MVGDLVTARQDGLHGTRMLVGGVAGHVERGRNLQPGEQPEDPAQAPGGSEAALRQHGQSAGVLGPLAEPGRLTVHVKGQGHRHLGVAGPGGEVRGRVLHAP